MTGDSRKKNSDLKIRWIRRWIIGNETVEMKQHETRALEI